MENNISDNDNNSHKSINNTKSRLYSLKQMLNADPIKLDTNTLQPNINDFPVSQQVKYIDYLEEKNNHKLFAEQVITNIIETYIKSKLLLNSPRLKDRKQLNIIEYSRLLLLTQISENNLISLQESIDGGDMSKEMYDSVQKAQIELRANMEATNKLLDKCDIYWLEYGVKYGIESEEEKIVQETTIKNPNENKHTIIDMSKLNEIIKSNIEESKK